MIQSTSINFLKISRWLFLALIVSVPLVRPFNIWVRWFQVPATDAIFVAVLFFWLIALIRRETSLRFDNLYFFLGVYALSLTISSIFSVLPEKSFLKLSGEFYLFALAIVAFNFALDRAFLKKIVLAWLAATALTVVAAAAGVFFFFLGYKTYLDNYFLFQFGSLPSGNYPRARGLFENANMMSNYLNVSVMLIALAYRTGWLRRKLAFPLYAGTWFAAALTISPGLGGILLSTCVWLRALAQERHAHLLAKASMIAGIFAASAFLFIAAVSPDTNNTDQDFYLPFVEAKFEPSVRALGWSRSLETFFENPVIGRGTGLEAMRMSYVTLSGQGQILTDAHNTWINLLALNGLLGFSSFLLLTIYVLKKCRFSFRELNESTVIRVALSCAFLGAFIYQGLLGSFEDARHLWLLIGLLVAAAHPPAEIGADRSGI